jgi:hypothetical protein
MATLFFISIPALVSLIWQTVYYFRPDTKGEKYADGVTILCGFIISAILAVAVAVSDVGGDEQAVYFINGMVFKGGTDWLYVLGTFLFGGFIAYLLLRIIPLILIFPFWFPFAIVHLFTKKYRQEPKNACCNPGVALLLAIFLGGLGVQWFYYKLYLLGAANILLLLVAATLGEFMPDSPLSIALLLLYFICYFGGIGFTIVLIKRKSVFIKQLNLHINMIGRTARSR